MTSYLMYKHRSERELQKLVYSTPKIHMFKVFTVTSALKKLPQMINSGLVVTPDIEIWRSPMDVEAHSKALKTSVTSARKIVCCGPTKGPALTGPCSATTGWASWAFTGTICEDMPGMP